MEGGCFIHMNMSELCFFYSGIFGSMKFQRKLPRCTEITEWYYGNYRIKPRLTWFSLFTRSTRRVLLPSRLNLIFYPPVDNAEFPTRCPPSFFNGILVWQWIGYGPGRWPGDLALKSSLNRRPRQAVCCQCLYTDGQLLYYGLLDHSVLSPNSPARHIIIAISMEYSIIASLLKASPVH